MFSEDAKQEKKKERNREKKQREKTERETEERKNQRKKIKREIENRELKKERSKRERRILSFLNPLLIPEYYKITVNVHRPEDNIDTIRLSLIRKNIKTRRYILYYIIYYYCVRFYPVL